MPPIREFIMQYRGHGLHRSAATHRAARTRTIYILLPPNHEHPFRWMDWKRKYITQGYRGCDGPEGYAAAITAAMEQIDLYLRLQAQQNAQRFIDTCGKYPVPYPEFEQLPNDPPQVLNIPPNNRKTPENE